MALGDMKAAAAAQGSGREAREELFQTLLDALPQQLCVLDGRGRVVAVNQAWRSFAAAGEPLLTPVAEGADYLGVCQRLGEAGGAARGGFAQRTAESCAAGIRWVLEGQPQGFVLEYPGNAGRWFVLRVLPLELPGERHALVWHEEVTERRRVEATLRENALDLRRLAAHLESVREEESARIAREIHDELGANLTMLKLGLASLLEQPADGLPRPPRPDALASLLQLAQSSIDIGKRISSSLRPRMLDTLGLVETIRWHVAAFSRHTGIACTVHLPEYIRISPGRSTAVYRVVQEALTNIARHAKASRVVLRAQKNRGELLLEIDDDGRGVVDADLLKDTSYGILGMRERSQFLGGEFWIRGEPGRGTHIGLRLPLAP